jgi:hypothetical protein
MTDHSALIERLEAFSSAEQTDTPWVADELVAEAAAALRDLTEWRDIATAPKDETWCILWFDGEPKAGFWSTGEDPDWYASEASSSSLTAFGDYPTRWLPLPLPSAPNQAKEAD